MSQGSPTSSTIDLTGSQASTSATASVANAFDRMKGPSQGQNTIQRDRCSRPLARYNRFYNPYEPPSDDLPIKYSPYANGEPLFDDRPAIVSRFRPQHTLAGASKRPRSSWVWPLGYAVDNHTKRKNTLCWVCKLCMLISLMDK